MNHAGSVVVTGYGLGKNVRSSTSLAAGNLRVNPIGGWPSAGVQLSHIDFREADIQI